MTTPTILVIDHDSITRNLLGVALKSEGYTVLEVEDGQTALKAIADHPPDLILQELLLPDVDGFELARQIRALPGGAQPPIIACSGFLSTLEQARIFEVGFTEYLVKPAEPARLLPLIQTYLAPISMAKEQQGAGRRILVADDDPLQRKLLTIYLEQVGFQVTTAGDGAQALEQARQSPPDAILSDVLMPQLDGVRLCLAVRQDPQLAHVPVVLTAAGYSEEADRRLARTAGASALVCRTPNLQEVIEALLASLREAPPVPSVTPEEAQPEDYTHRMIRQLEHQASRSSTLTQLLACREAELAILGTLAQTLETTAGLDTSLNQMLHCCLHAAGVSRGAAYLCEPDGRLSLCTQIGYPGDMAGSLPAFFGHAGVLRQALERGEPLAVPSARAQVEEVGNLLETAGARSLLITPLVLGEERLGVLVLASDHRDLGEDWAAFARAIGSQTGRVIGLVRALSRLREHGEYLQRLVETMPLGLIALDRDGRVTFANAATERLFGRPAGGLTGQLHDDLALQAITPEGQSFPDAQRPFSQVLRTGEALDDVEGAIDPPDGERVMVSVNAAPLHDATGAGSGLIASLSDSTRRKRAEQVLLHQAVGDALTDLPNRRLLHDRLQQAVLAGGPVALLLLDLDPFGEANETIGHHHGDILQQQIEPRLQSILRPADTLARLGRDEFALLLPATGVAAATQTAQTILQALAYPFVVEEQILEIRPSIGIALSPDQGSDADTLLRQSDVAMYLAKQGNEGYAVYAPERDPRGSDRLALVRELRDGIAHDQLFLCYQPQATFTTGRVCAVEALVRWRHPRHGLLLPDRFIALAEQTGVIRQLTSWMLNDVLRQCQAWHWRSGLPLAVAVNLSARDLQDPQFPDTLARLLETWNVPPTMLKLEISERTIGADSPRVMEALARLGSMGLRLAIDDFGTGCSSLAHLKRLPAQELKIDTSFVLDLAKNAGDMTIVRSIIDLGHNLGLEVVAEGVENQEIWDLLAALGCDTAQGYSLSHPLTVPDLERWLAE